MIVAIDWDGTFTAIPNHLENFIGDLINNDITVIFVTGRHDVPEHRIDPPLDCPVVYAGNEYKRKAAEKAGYMVNIWIDDMPEMIGESKILKF